MTAVSDETGREALQSPQHIIEGIILRRLHDERIEGYTLEMSKEIAAALSAAPVGEPLRRIVLDTLNAVAPAVENLSVHQEQCDRDGVMVKVSRQALDEVLNAVNEVAMQSAITTSPASPVAQEPVATKATQQASADFLHEEMIKLGSPLTYTACLTLTKRITDTNTLSWAGEVNKLCTEIGSLKNEIAALKSAATPPAPPAGVGADEIARASNWKLVDGTMTTGESVIFDGSFIIAKVTRREDAELILALLSRGSGSDQQRRHEEQSTQNI